MDPLEHQWFDRGEAVRLATSFCFLATLATVTWEKVAWEPGGYKLTAADIFGAAFLLLRLLALFRAGGVRRVGAAPRVVTHLAAFALALLLVYLLGAIGLETQHARAQLAKGLALFTLHFGFLLVGLAYLTKRSVRFFRSALVAFVGGIAVSAAYGAAQLASARLGYNLDSAVISPLTRRVTRINVYGAVHGAKVYRPNGLSTDSNHLAIMLDLALLLLVALHAARADGRWRRASAGALIAGLLLVELSTLSRSGYLGLAVGVLVLALSYRRSLLAGRMLAPLAAAALVVALAALRRPHFYETVFRSRLQTGGKEGGHFTVYSVIPHALHTHPLFGAGLNNFAIYARQFTDKAQPDPQSVYVALLVETGVLGTLVFLLFIAYAFAHLDETRLLGNRLLGAGHADGLEVRALAWGSAAGIAATMAANTFYLTMPFFYFYAFLMLALGIRLLFDRRGMTARAD